jgi:hypothetical protein
MVLVKAFQFFVGFIPATINAMEDLSQILKRVHADGKSFTLTLPAV